MANVKKPSKITASTQAYLDINEIKEGVVKLKDGSMRAVIYVSSINFDLKSESEKEAIIGSFQGFLNSLNFPIQITIISKKIDLEEYLNNFKELEKEQKNELLKLQISEYVNFITGLLEEVNIMEKMFFVVVPYFPAVISQKGLLNKITGGQPSGHTNFENDKVQLMDRVDVIVSGLKSVGLNCASLDTNGLIQLYYSLYNPENAAIEKIKNIEDLTADVVSFGGMKKSKEADHLEI